MSSEVVFFRKGFDVSRGCLYQRWSVEFNYSFDYVRQLASCYLYFFSQLASQSTVTAERGVMRAGRQAGMSVRMLSHLTAPWMVCTLHHVLIKKTNCKSACLSIKNIMIENNL